MSETQSPRDIGAPRADAPDQVPPVSPPACPAERGPGRDTGARPPETGAVPADIESVDDLFAYLGREHGWQPGRDDPVAMLWTIHRVILADVTSRLDAQMTAHRTGLAAALEAAAKALTAAVGAALGEVREEVSSEAVRDGLARLTEQARLTETLEGAMRRHVRVLWGLTALNLAGLGLGLLIWSQVLRS